MAHSKYDRSLLPIGTEKIKVNSTLTSSTEIYSRPTSFNFFKKTYNIFRNLGREGQRLKAQTIK